MRHDRFVSGGLAFLAFVGGLLSAQAQGPAKINFQGRLADGTNLFSGSVGLQLRIYTNAVGGSPVYEDSNTVTAVEGVYSTFIGDNTVSGSLPAALAGAQAWVEVVANGLTFSPRYELASVPYALNTASGSNYVNRAGDVMTGNLALNLTGISSPNAAYEQGGGVSVLATAATNALWAVGVRGRVSQTTPSSSNRAIRGVTGAASSVGGTNSSLHGGYFNARVYAAANSGAASTVGVGADAEVDAGATGFTSSQILVGGRFGASASNAGAARAFGVLGAAVEPHTGDNVGLFGLARNSGVNNVGVAGVVHVADAVIASADGIPEGAAVYAWNGNWFGMGYGIYSLAYQNYFSGLVNADGGYAVGGVPGISTNIDVIRPGGVTNTLIFSNGILTGVE